ncbi:MAG TPA: CBS domain-containing protein [Candidatus Saccharimonadales bacterium]|nr:CBS domain-containing protein [Candidatus Saccharimonadales bacterium]
MIISVFALLLITLGLFALALQRFYSSVPAKELKRLAARGDGLAEALYRPVAYGSSMRMLLWTVFGLSTAGGLLLLQGLPTIVAYIAAALTLAAAVAAQSLRLTVRSAHFAVQTAPALNWLMNYLHTPFDVVARLVNRYRTHTAHSGLYEKEDLIALLNQQTEQPDNRIAKRDLELITRAAQFDDVQAADVVMPMSRVKLVKLDDNIGPVLLGELHNSGQNSFLVYDESPDHVVGTLFLRDAVAAKEGGLVKDLMHPRLCFVHEDFSLRQVLQAFAHTGQFMVVVINAFEEPVGVITLQHLLEQLVGGGSGDGFDSFEDRSAVAAFKPVAEPVLAPVTEDVLPEDTIPGETAEGETPREKIQSQSMD